MRRTLTVALLATILNPLAASAEKKADWIEVHAYTHLVTVQDTLADGPNTEAFPIMDQTMFLWIDFHPGSRFPHHSSYLLITADEMRVEAGSKWPELNGKPLFQDGVGGYAVPSPFEVRSMDSGIMSSNVYAYPHVLTCEDTLTDGPGAEPFELDGNTLLLWVDFMPEAFFAHETGYILISREGVRLEEGDWWPEIEGRRVLHGCANTYVLNSPFRLPHEKTHGKPQ